MLDLQQPRPLQQIIEDVLENCYMQINGIDVGIPFIIGSPGIGKTACIKQLATKIDKFKIGVVSTHIALKPIEELGGIPKFKTIFTNDEKKYGTIWSIPDIITLLESIKKDYDLIIWLLDDAHLMDAQHMELLYELFTEKSIRGHTIPQNCAMVLAGNNSSKTGTKTMFSAIVNRCSLLPVYPAFEDWKYNFAIPNNIHQTILAFLSNKQYQSYFLQEEQSTSAWASPRSWTRLSNEISTKQTWRQKELPSEIIAYLSASYVGKEVSNFFTTFYSVYTTLTKKISLNSKPEKLPESISDVFSISFALLNDYFTRLKTDKSKNDRKTLLKLLTSHIENFILNNYSEVAIMLIKDVTYSEKALFPNLKDTAGKVIFENISSQEIKNQIIHDLKSALEYC